MNVDKTPFAQIREFLPWTTFHRIVGRYARDHRGWTLPCAEQFRIMAFAQITYPGKPAQHRDLPFGPGRQALPHGFAPTGPPPDHDANESRDWRIYTDFANRLIGQARGMPAGDSVEWLFLICAVSVAISGSQSCRPFPQR